MATNLAPPATPERQLIESLRNPALYPNRPLAVEVRETHASCVFLVGDEAFKLKKPVDFGFLDYSTLERRRLMCGREVELNRRLAPDVYLGVVPVTVDAGHLALGGKGEIVDYLVHMRRLPDETMLRCLIERDAASPADLKNVGRRIAAFHAAAARGPAIDRFGHPDTIARNARENFRQVEPFEATAVSTASFDEIVAFTRGFFKSERQTLEARVRGGHIRDCHGDLRTDHVYLDPDGTIRIVDCIEFNRRFRYGDTATDMAFLAMDLDARGAPDLAEAFVAAYEDALGDDTGPVLDFYRCYRACTRGKVACLRLGELDQTRPEAHGALNEAKLHFHLALRYARHDRQPRLILMSGLTGTGKSTLAAELSVVLAAHVGSADQTRKQLAGLSRHERVVSGLDEGLYAPEVNLRVYAELLAQAKRELARGRSVILDATYRRRADRNAARDLALCQGARFLAVECSVDEATARERFEARARAGGGWSDGTWEVRRHQSAQFEPLNELPANDHVRVDTGLPIDCQVNRVVAALESA